MENESTKKIKLLRRFRMRKPGVKLFAEVLEKVGYHQALEFVERELVKIAEREQCSLSEAAKKFIDSDPEKAKYTGYAHCQLKVALTQINKGVLKLIDKMYSGKRPRKKDKSH